MVKIRYAELPAGLHVATEAGDGCTVVYLKPGLTRAQRKDALMVARRTARFGHGPHLPALDMAFALAADRSRTTARIMASAMRKHPLLLLPLLALVLGIIAAGVMAYGATVITVPPHVSSAQYGGLDQVNLGQLSNLEPQQGSGSSGAPHPAPPSAASSGPVHPAWHGDAHHSRWHTHAQPVVDLPHLDIGQLHAQPVVDLPHLDIGQVTAPRSTFSPGLAG